jgi:predicted HTH transcriptional regulator
MDNNLWTFENFETFLEARRRLLANQINEFIGSFKSDNIKQLSLAQLLEKDEGQQLEFKSTLRVDLQNNKIPMNVIENQSLKTIAGFLNQDNGGTLLIGVDDGKTPIGLETDYNSLRKKDRDGFLLHLTNIIAEKLGKEYLFNINISFENIDEKDIAVVKVIKAKEFVSLENKNYIRINNQTTQLTPIQTAEYILQVWKS